MPPGALVTTFDVERRSDSPDDRGRIKTSFVPRGEVSGVLAQASPSEQLRYQQLQHPVTHTLVIDGPTSLKPGDRLTEGGRHLYVQTVEDAMGLGFKTLVGLEERRE
jgi:hypothetical protein